MIGWTENRKEKNDELSLHLSLSEPKILETECVRVYCIIFIIKTLLSFSFQNSLFITEKKEQFKIEEIKSIFAKNQYLCFNQLSS